MADDIDDLLNDIETQLSLTETRKRGHCNDEAKSHTAGSGFNTRPHPSASTDDISDILSDSWDDEDVLTQSSGAGRKNHAVKLRSGNSPSSIPGATKCFPVYVGGSSSTSGLSTTVNKRSCDRLRCTACDFAVSSFNDVQWAADTDYLFLRNNMPDFERVRTKLVPKKGARAYACQCKWLSVSELMDLHSQPSVKWVCGKH